MSEKDKNIIFNEIKEHVVKITELLESLVVNEEQKETKVETPKKAITLEEVRTVLANLSRDGFTKEVKELLRKHGSEKLSTINQSEYEAILNEAGEIGNAK